jgi:hypothetical protein
VEPLVQNNPFMHICVDYMSLNGHQFRVFMDTGTRAGLWSSWEPHSTGYDVTKFLAKLCEDYGVSVS